MARATPQQSTARASGDPADIAFTKIGATRFDFSDPYHLALTVRWPAFAVAIFAFYGLITSFFAALYLAQPGCVANARAGSLGDAFFFSIETLATVGYGEMAPATLYGHLVSSAEIVTGMAFTAIMTGLVFVRFSKPRAKIVYADNAVITRHNGRPTLMLRIANGRTSLLTDLKVQLNALMHEVTDEGRRYRAVHELRLARANTPMFPLTQTLMHEIDAQSPLAGLDADSLAASDVWLFLSVEARDPGLAAMVHDLRMYPATRIKFGMHYSDAITSDDGGHVVADLRRISLIEPDRPAHDPPGDAGAAQP
jgi:inward rectifier potassium channel